MVLDLIAAIPATLISPLDQSRGYHPLALLKLVRTLHAGSTMRRLTSNLPPRSASTLTLVSVTFIFAVVAHWYRYLLRRARRRRTRTLPAHRHALRRRTAHARAPTRAERRHTLVHVCSYDRVQGGARLVCHRHRAAAALWPRGQRLHL
jgi:hypothetical protein